MGPSQQQRRAQEASSSSGAYSSFQKRRPGSSGSSHNSSSYSSSDDYNYEHAEHEQEPLVASPSSKMNTDAVGDISADDVENTQHQQQQQQQGGGVTEQDAFTCAHSREDEAVFFLRLIVLGALGLSSMLLAVAVYQYTRNVEQDKFQQAFAINSQQLFDSVGQTFYNTLGAVDTFVVSMVSFAKHTHQQWPYVTIPDYAVQMSKIRARSNVAVFNQFNFVATREQRELWENNYTVANDDWVQEGLEVQKHDVNYHGTTEDNEATMMTSGGPILGADGQPLSHDRHGPFMPSWQSSPVMANTNHPYNWDFSAVYNDPVYLQETIQHKRAIIAEVWNMPTTNQDDTDTDTSTVDEATEAIQDFIEYLDPTRDPTEPLSDILYPIVDDASDAVMYGGDSTGIPVGILIATVFWSDLIRDVLPHGTGDGILFVFENPCRQTFTYRIDGPDVKYLGPGDLHDPKYDSLMEEVGFQDLLAIYSSSNAVYTGLPLSEKGCPFNPRVYPSEDNEANFISSDPIVYAATVVIIFGLTVGLFSTYHFCVERRQQIITKTAVESAANVSLLEEKVQERTRTLQITNDQLEEANQRIRAASALRLQHFASMSHEVRGCRNKGAMLRCPFVFYMH